MLLMWRRMRRRLHAASRCARPAPLCAMADHPHAFAARLHRTCTLREHGAVEAQADAHAPGAADDGEGAAGRLYDLGDDALGCVLSFLSPLDIAVCSRVSQRLRRLCRDEDKVSDRRLLLRFCTCRFFCGALRIPNFGQTLIFRSCEGRGVCCMWVSGRVGWRRHLETRWRELTSSILRGFRGCCCCE